MRDYDFLFFIGRFQPFHNGHIEVIKEALNRANRVGILIGSATTPRTLRNPWTYDERVQMIKGAFNSADQARIDFNPISDHPYNDTVWIEDVQRAVDNLTWNYRVGKDFKIGLIGHSKDHSSFYLNLFPQWGSINVPQNVIYNSTDIRVDYLKRNPVIPTNVPANVAKFLSDFHATPEFGWLVKEQEYVTKYKQQWANTPYPVTFVTTDAVVTQSGHILLIERKSEPGKGMLALPGGFLDHKDRSPLEGVLRELREETRLKVPEPVLRGSLAKTRVYADPYRSERGRVITHAHHFALASQRELPLVKGRTDAKRAFWTPIAEVKESEMFEDHYHIIRDILELA